MKKKSKTKKLTTRKVSRSDPSPTRSSRMKCACASCQCTVDMERALRKGNLVYCSRACMTACTLEKCMCEHDHCMI